MSMQNVFEYKEIVKDKTETNYNETLDRIAVANAAASAQWANHNTWDK